MKAIRHPVRRLAISALIGAAAVATCASASAETVRFAQEYGVGYLPLMVMRHNHLIQKYAKKEGIDHVKVTWATFGGGAAMNAALLSGSLDFASGGVGPLLKIWDKTQGLNNVHGVAALNSMPNLLNTTNPKIKNLGDITNKDRIAVPAVKVSIQAITLEMAAAKKWGMKHYDKLDHLTVSMKHPDAMAALLSGRGEIDIDFTSPPYFERELQDSKVHTILSSYDVLGGKSTFNTLWTSKTYYTHHPKMYKAVFEALQAADRYIKANPHKAAKIYLEEANSKLPEKLIYGIVTDPKIEFTTTPKNIMKYARFMKKTGSIDHQPTSWKQVFFKNVWNEPGS